MEAAKKHKTIPRLAFKRVIWFQCQPLILIIESLLGGLELETVSVHHIVLVVSVPCGERLVEGIGPHIVVEVVAPP